MVPFIVRDLSKAIARGVVERYETAEGELQKALSTLNPAQKNEVQRRFQTKEKSLKTAYVLCALGGIHFLYLGEVKKFILFQLTLGGFLAWWFWELGILFFRVAEINQREKLAIIRRLPQPRPQPQPAS